MDGAILKLGYRPGLDGLRGLAILLVVPFNLHWGVPAGYIGVDLFFVLSGFLITTLLLEEHAHTGRIDFGAFYLRRALRLLPALVFLLSAFLGLTVLFLGLDALRENATASAIALFYVGNWVLAFGGYDLLGPLVHTWSLAVEEQFYVLWPPILAFLVARRLAPARLQAFLIAGIAASAVLRLGLSLGGAAPLRMYAGTDTRADALLLGCLLAVVIHAQAGRPAWFLGSETGKVAGLLFVGGAFFLPLDSSAFMQRGGFTAVALAGAVLIGHVVAQPEGLVGRLACTPTLVRVGRVSYGLYLWHAFLGTILTPQRLGLGGIGLEVVTALAIAAAVLFSWFVVERPALRLKKRWSRVTPVGGATSGGP